MIATDAAIRTVSINRRNAGYKSATGTITAEASTLGLAAGDWPLLLNVRSSATGNVRRFIRARAEYVGHGEDRELGAFLYTSRELGLTLKIYND